MIEKRRKNIPFLSISGRKSLYDLSIPKEWNKKMIIFLHGYMGFKDWGAWNLLEDFFVAEHFGFLKFNFSHNGGTVNEPIDFSDLDAFADNSYTKEIDDLSSIIKELEEQQLGIAEIYLIGHSRGGGIAALQGKNPSVSKIALLAPISSIEERFPKGEVLKRWENDGVYYRLNGRTNQQMPHNYSQYEDFLRNKDKLSIELACCGTTIPYLIIHGAKDSSVDPSNGEKIARWTGGSYILLPTSAHTFGASQPWTQKELPLELKEACTEMLRFFNTKT